MKNIFFVVFLFLPFYSYSQTVLSSFEENVQDSSLTIFLKSSYTEHKRDTIYPKEIPKELVFIFEDIDSTNRRSYAVVTLARGRRAINTSRARTNRLIFPIQYVIWQTDFFVIEAKENRKDSTKIFLQTIQILPKPILAEIKRKKEQIIQDCISKIENHLLAVEYYNNRFEKLKEPQENLTEKDKKNIQVLSVTNPPIVNRIKGQKFIDETEISVINWLEYLLYLHNDSSKQHYELAFPDTTGNRNLYNTSDFDELYLNYPIYRYYPVVGITYEQAQQYCIWRGNMVSHYLNEDQKKKYKTYEITVHYRLPTKEEWEYAAIKDDLNKQFGGYSTKRRYTEKEKRRVYRSAKRYSDSTRTIEQIRLDMKNYFESDTSYKRMFNYKPTYQNPYFDKNLLLFDGRLITNWVYLYEPTNQFKLYNMFGNVAEMTSEKGIAKGGSFYHTLEECAADRVQIYDSPLAWLGFRCVAEVVVRKKEVE